MFSQQKELKRCFFLLCYLTSFSENSEVPGHGTCHLPVRSGPLDRVLFTACRGDSTAAACILRQCDGDVRISQRSPRWQGEKKHTHDASMGRTVYLPTHLPYKWDQMGVSKNRDTPKSSILIGFSIINHPFFGYPYFWKHPNEPNVPVG